MIHRVIARRIVYRDLKPENVSSSDDERRFQMDGSLWLFHSLATENWLTV